MTVLVFALVTGGHGSLSFLLVTGLHEPCCISFCCCSEYSDKCPGEKAQASTRDSGLRNLEQPPQDIHSEKRGEHIAQDPSRDGATHLGQAFPPQQMSLSSSITGMPRDPCPC